MNLHQGLFGTLFIVALSVIAYYFSRQGNYSSFRLKSLGYMGIICGVLAINAILLVVAPRVPQELKDGDFGGAGGILFGSCILNAVLGGILLGFAWSKSNDRSKI